MSVSSRGQMLWLARMTLRKVRGLCCFLPSLVMAGLHATAAQGQQVLPLGTLTPFYRATQLQGHLFGMGLEEVPPYLLGSDLAFPYRPKPGFRREVLFADSFSIVRVMGGYPEEWLRRFNILNPTLGRRSLDYATRRPDGVLEFHPELIRARLQPYLEAGYKPADITLALDNTPWDLATPDGQPPKLGVYGRRTPPGDLNEWAAVVRHLAEDLKAFLGSAAGDLTFETGVEYDGRPNFDGTSAEFFGYYEATERAIHQVLPTAHFNPGEFTGSGKCVPQVPTCVYDTRDLILFTEAHHIAPHVVPRSLHGVADRGAPYPSLVAKALKDSYARLPSVTPEVHQFGLLFQPFGETSGGDTGAMQANWEFQTLIRLMVGGAPRRVFHWGTVDGPHEILNGSGFVRLVLDHYLGRQVDLLPTSEAAQPTYRSETVAVLLTGGPSPAMIISSFSLQPDAGTREVTVDLPSRLFPAATSLREVRFKAGEDVISVIRRDLAADSNLRREFDACALCEASPLAMAADIPKGRRMVVRNWPRYERLLRDSLRWKSPVSDVTVTGSRLSVKLVANEMIVLEPR